MATPLSCLIDFLTQYDSACGLQSSHCAIISQIEFGVSTFHEPDALVRLVDRRFHRARRAYMNLSARDQNVLSLAWNDCPGIVPEQIRTFRGMVVRVDEGAGDANLALLTAWIHGCHPIELIAVAKRDKKALSAMIVKAATQLSASVGRFNELYDRQG